jgi:uncharacterized protein YfiM (DUF2279 family)
MCRVNGSDREGPAGLRAGGFRGILPPLLLSLFLFLPRSVQAQDDWFAPDKLMHFLGGFFVTSIGYTVAQVHFEVDHDQARAIGVGAAVVASIGKEVWDGLSGRGDPSLKDLFWDGVGIGLGVAFVNLFEERIGPEEGVHPHLGSFRADAGPLRLDLARPLRPPVSCPFLASLRPVPPGRLPAPRNPLTIRLRPVP